MTRPDSSPAHAPDVVSLTAGLLAVVLAGLYLVTDLTGAHVTAGLVAAVAVLTLGAVGLLAGLRRLHRR